MIIGLSGGLDSALTAVIAVDALGAGRVRGLYLPSRYSAAASRADSQQLAAGLGVEYREISIESVFRGYLALLPETFSGAPGATARENIQARIRGNILMAFSNRHGDLVLTTGNKSEIAAGYCTLYGDMAGGFSVLKDVSKTMVRRLAEARNRRDGVIPARTISRAPSAELRPRQKDSDTLPDYGLMDPVMEAFVESNLSPAEIAALGHDPEIAGRVAALVEASEYKRRQAPPGIRITPRAFGKDWRLPVTSAFRSGRGAPPDRGPRP